ncbi:MAG: hypothetical protein V2A53_10340 [bacterium]
MKFNPLFVILKSIGLLLGGRAQFLKDRIGKTIIREDGQKFTVFREVVMKPKANQSEETGRKKREESKGKKVNSLRKPFNIKG